VIIYFRPQMNRYVLLFLLSLICAVVESFGQSYYDHDTTNNLIVIHEDSLGINHDLMVIDTNVNRLVNFNRTGWNGLVIGGYGSPYNGYTRPSRQGVWLNGAVIGEHMTYKPEDATYYQVKVPFSEITYFNGPKEEQQIGFVHSQNLNDRLNIGLKFRRTNSEGFYQDQDTKHSNSMLTYNYVSSNGRFKSYGYGGINIATIEENGGIVYDTSFTENEEPNRIRVETYLTDARNELDRRFYGVTNSYGFGGNFERKGLNRMELYVSNHYELNDVRYLDEAPDTAYYQLLGIEVLSGSVTDHIQQRSLKNDAGFMYRFSKNTSLGASMGYNWNKVFQNGQDTVMVESRPKANFTTTVGGFTLKADAGYTLEGYGKDTYAFSGILSKNFKSRYRVALGFNMERNPVFWEYRYYENEAEFWRNGSRDVQTTQFKAEISDRRELNNHLKASLNTITNYAYFDIEGRPDQFTNPLSFIEVQGGYLLKYLKPFYIDFDGMFRASFDEDAPINLPTFQTTTDLYVEAPFFKKALKGQFGLSVYYVSSFKADAYQPLGRRFYQQDEVETGGFVYIDPYLALNIGAVTGFFKYSNITQGLTDYNYIIVPHYPLPDGGLRFGVTWRMNN